MKGGQALASGLATSGYDGLLTIAQAVLDAIPVAVYVCSSDGTVVRFNELATKLWGRTPRAGDTEERFCGACRLYEPNGSLLPHAKNPMAAVLRTGEPVRSQEVIIERPDGSRISVLVNIEVLRDEETGRIQGAINCFQDISDRKQAEAALASRNTRLSALNRIGRSLSSDLKLQHVVQAVTESATKLSGAQFGAFFYNVVDRKGERYTLFTLSGAPREAFERFGVPRNTAVFDPTFRGTEIVRSNDIRKDPRYGRNPPHHGMPRGHLPVVSYLAVPVISRSGEVHGGLFFGHEQPGVFTAEAEEIVAGIAAHAAIAIDNVRLLQAAAKRTDEQAALYQFTDRLQRAANLNDVYEAALDAIARALGCERASILLFDQFGVMRFVAWRGLSDAYRKTVDGHCPWTTDANDPQPIFIDDVESAGLPDSLSDAVKAERIGALAFIPLVANGRLIGKFMTYYGAPHTFAPSSIELAVTIARQLGFSVQRLQAEEARSRAEEALRAREAELEAVINRTPFMLVRCGRDLRYKFVSQAFADMIGQPPDELAGKSIVEIIGDEGFSTIFPYIQKVLQGQRTEYECEVKFKTVGPRHIHAAYLPDEDGRGNVKGWIASILDLTERKRVESERDLLAAELSHRVKNTLATMQAVAAQSLRGTDVDSTVRETFEGRLMALSKAHNILAQKNWEGADMHEIVHEILRNSRDHRIQIDGPRVSLMPNAVIAIAMAMHELAANAVKYGALSKGTGQVCINWDIHPPSAMLTLEWKESGGPIVGIPQRRGFGSRLIERNLAVDLGGEARLEYRAEGVICTIKSPLPSLNGPKFEKAS